ncbi:hypothetical protein DVH24_008975 [Malus domestica]|uniref:Uncharacterized protein n=1 Tax=Malus domestica TaxID=3750 RepID=A0A498JTI0_MALDO|nr:hypothetical protein DVH24_008975 [Malus domestica]
MDNDKVSEMAREGLGFVFLGLQFISDRMMNQLIDVALQRRNCQYETWLSICWARAEAMRRGKRCRGIKTRRLRHSPKQAKDTSCRPRFSDEEYIVFFFKEDGAFEVVKNGKVEASNTIDCASRNSPRPANRKDEEEEENYSGPEPPPSSNVEDRPTVSVESSDSNQSDGSTGSFVFPVGQGMDRQSCANAEIRSYGLEKAQGSLHRLSVSVLSILKFDVFFSNFFPMRLD